METLTIKTSSVHFTDEEFFNFCAENRDLQIEKDKNQTIYIMAPTGGFTGNTNVKISTRIEIWNERTGFGYSFDSSTGFTLPNNAMRSPDTSWIKKERWEALPFADREKFAHICPDFIIELRSRTDSLKQLREKMDEWIENGCRLAWLIDPTEEKTYIYRPEKETEILTGFDRKISGENVLQRFELNLKEFKM